METTPDFDPSTDTAPILVTGATGTIGGELVRLLVAAGRPVRAMARRPAQLTALADAGAEPVLADLDDAAALRTAMTGCAQVFLLTAPMEDQLAQERRAMDAAVAASVRRIVRVSAGDSNVGTAVPWARAHAHADRYLAGTGLSWTVLRPSAFFQNLVGSAPAVRRGFLPQTTGRGASPWIDARDVAAVAAAVLTSAGHDRATYFLTGPQPLTMTAIAERLGAATGRRVRFVQLPSPVFWLMLRTVGGQSRFMAGGLRAQFADVVRPGHDIDATAEVDRLTGRPARTLDDYLHDHLEAFR